MDIPPLPQLSEDLVKALDVRFPDRCPDLSMTDREIWHYAGQRHVIEFLKGQHELQKETRFSNVLATS